jgi:hypothetical protein
MTQGQIAQAMDQNTNLYVGVWFHPVYTPTTEMFTLAFFTEDKGYEEADIAIINKMQVGDVSWFGPHPIASKTHLVTRVF